MRVFRTIYFIVSMVLISFLGHHYYRYQFDKKVIFVDKSKEDLISFFNEICLGYEYGNGQKVIRKWKEPLRLFIVKDSGYNEQVKFIDNTISNINKLVDNSFYIAITEDSINANGHLFLCSQDQLKLYSMPNKSLFGNLEENIFGYVNVKTDMDYYITKASIFINTTKPLKFQKSTIIEEITQSLGLGNDTDIYLDSMFYQYKPLQNWATLKYSEFDEKIIQLLYSEEIKVGLNRLETDPILRELLD